ncbi:hypothetical protein DPMN_057315 [Dreissena polymorpha]|uniref:Uncharacterized protein n=1 Tax=Dreissena polymorpha TaxID=45954 RepID=A0A9D4BZV7_DREPO|nr:hypothetical protein DPMN_057315 [Dreissena polymorpha]
MLDYLMLAQRQAASSQATSSRGVRGGLRSLDSTSSNARSTDDRRSPFNPVIYRRTTIIRWYNHTHSTMVALIKPDPDCLVPRFGLVNMVPVLIHRVDHNFDSTDRRANCAF